MADIKYVVTVDASGALKEMKPLDEALKDIKDHSGTADTSFGSLWKQFAVGQLAADALKKGLGFLKDQIGACIKGAMDEEQSEKNLEAALGITGRTVSALLPQYIAYSQQKSLVTKYTHEEIEATMALLVQMTDLDTKGIQKATEGAMGLASVMGTDLHSATMMITKAMEGNYTALSRVGIKVNENLTPQEKQLELMRQLGPLYARSEAETGTFAGSLAQLKKAWDEIREAIGSIITQNPELRDSIIELKDKIIEFTSSEKFTKFLTDASTFLGNFIKTFIDVADKVIEYASAVARAISDAHGVIMGTIFFRDVKMAMKDAMRDAKKEAEEFAASLTNIKAPAWEVQYMMEQGEGIWENYKQWMWNADKKARDLADANKKLKPKINETGNAVGDTTDEMKKWAKAVKDHDSELKDFKISLADCSSGFGDLSTQTKLWANDAEVATKSANELGDEVIAIGKGMDTIPANANTALKETKGYFDGLYVDIARGFGNCITNWAKDLRNFKELFKNIWASIADTLARKLGEMATDWALDFIDKIVKDSKKGGEDIAKGINAGFDLIDFAAVGGAFLTLGTVIHDFAQTADDDIYLMYKGTEMSFNEMKNMWKELGIEVERVIWLYQLAAQYAGASRGTIPANNSIKPKGPGGAGTGAGGTTPGTGGGPGGRGPQTIGIPVVINIDGRAVAQTVAEYVPELTRTRQMVVHRNALVEY